MCRSLVRRVGIATTIIVVIILPSDYIMPDIKILRNDAFYVLSGLDPRKAYEPDGVSPIVLRNRASVLAPCLLKLLCLSTIDPSFLLEVCLHSICS